MEDLTMDNILSLDEVENLFVTEDNQESQESSPEKEETKENDTITEEVNSEELFDEPSESVGNEDDDNEETEDATPEKSGASPKNNFYSSIAKALKEDGVFPDLDDDVADNIKEAEDLADVIEQQVNSRLDEKQRRIDEALSNGVEPSVIKSYENTLNYLNQITEEFLQKEDEQSENVRKQLIYQDLINRGLSEDEAKEDLQEILDNGTDIKKAIRALASNKDYFNKGYQKVLNDAKEEAANEEKERLQMEASLRKSILEDSKLFGEISVDKATRQKICDNISKPIYKDKKTGEIYTALQKYEMENKEAFMKNVGIIFTLTDGFKNLDGLVRTKVNKEVKKGLRELEHTLNNTTRTSNGSLKFVSGVDEDPESSARSWGLDV